MLLITCNQSPESNPAGVCSNVASISNGALKLAEALLTTMGWSTWMAIWVALVIAYLCEALGRVSAFWGVAWPFEHLVGDPKTI